MLSGFRIFPWYTGCGSARLERLVRDQEVGGSNPPTPTHWQFLKHLTNQPINILIVEDNLAHLQLTEYILHKNDVPGNIYSVRDGQEALDYLYRKPSFADESRFPVPDLILLDLNLPRCDGREVLRILKNDNSLKEIPVVIVSTSDREEDVSYALQHGAAAYISKSGGFESLSEKLAGVARYARQK